MSQRKHLEMLEVKNTRNKNNMDERILQLLEEIKKLLILQLVKGGAPTSTDEVGAALGITGRAVRNVATASKRQRKSKK